MIRHVNVDPETTELFHRIEKMTGHPVGIMLERAVEEGVVEILAKYARNPKYKNRFKEFFPKFVDETVETKKNTTELFADSINEMDALNLFQAFRKKFGWAGTVFMRGDVNSVARRDLTDEEWKKVTASHPWKKGIQDRACESAADLISMALSDAGIIPATCKKCGSELTIEEIRCTDVTCPYSDRDQDEEYEEG